jgi:ABC-2 type transport system permease protein
VTAIALALRLGRWGILGFSVLAFVSNLIVALAFYQVAGHTPAERATFGRSINLLATQLTVLLPPPVRPDTVGGFIQYRGYGGLAILFAVWALVSAGGAARGDEERGLVEAEIATSLSRVRLVGSRVIAFALGSLVAGMAAGAGVIIGVAIGGETIPFRSVLEATVVLGALAACCYSLTLLIGQLTAARVATATAGIVLLVLFLINSLSRTFSWLSSLRWVSPFRYHELSQPLPPGGPFDVRATLILVGAALVAAIAAALAFAYRDLGSPLFMPPVRAHMPSYESSRTPWWRIPVARSLYQHRFGLAAWTVGMAALAVVFVSMTRSIVDPLLSVPQIARYLTRLLHGAIFSSFFGYFWFSSAELLFAAFAISQVARWAADDSEGRLELVLGQPFSRAGVIVERAAVLTVGAIAIAAATAVAIGYAARLQGIDLDRSRLIESSLLLVPFTLVFAGAGSLLASWSPRAAVGLLGGVAFATYLEMQVGTFFKWPEWVQDLSPFKLFGNPMSDGINGLGLALMVLISIVGFGSSILLMQRRDVGA